MLTYNFANIGSDSLYEYLYKCIKNDILLGNIRPGEKLPSKRTFAKNLGISVITVENAYAQLVAEGYLWQTGRLPILRIFPAIRRIARFFPSQSGRGRCVLS